MSYALFLGERDQASGPVRASCGHEMYVTVEMERGDDGVYRAPWAVVERAFRLRPCDDCWFKAFKAVRS